MKVYITGVSKGLGEAFAHHFLEQGYEVTGIGRSHRINHPSFKFISCDLSDRRQVEEIDFGNISDDVVCINNAGIIGNIQRISDQKEPDAFEVMMVNSIAPMLISSKIAKAVAINKHLSVINISSGAGRRSIPSWASYCSSKAALDRFSETFFLEEKEKGRRIKVFSVAPGVIDTEMQKTIRSTDPTDFSSLSRFRELKEANQLCSPSQVVDKILKLLYSSENEEMVICAV
jgi:benzil reductase ((S)-benzoin forming)